MPRIKKQSFKDLANAYAQAETVDDITKTGKNLINFVEKKIDDVDVSIEGFTLYIDSISRKSLSTSIIAELLSIDTKIIDDRGQQQHVWRICL